MSANEIFTVIKVGEDDYQNRVCDFKGTQLAARQYAQAHDYGAGVWCWVGDGKGDRGRYNEYIKL